MCINFGHLINIYAVLLNFFKTVGESQVFHTPTPHFFFHGLLLVNVSLHSACHFASTWCISYQFFLLLVIVNFIQSIKQWLLCKEDSKDSSGKTFYEKMVGTKVRSVPLYKIYVSFLVGEFVFNLLRTKIATEFGKYVGGVTPDYQSHVSVLMRPFCAIFILHMIMFACLL